MPERIVILGNSGAALAAVGALQARRGERSITMVSKEACYAYSPVLTTYYVRGSWPESKLYLTDADFYRQRNIACHFGTAAVELDAAAQRVTLDNGTRLGYDKLLIATGASPKQVRGLEPEAAADICYLRTIEDARRIRERATHAKHAIVLGAGLVSLQVAAAIARPDLRVTCIVSSQHILSQNIDATCAELLRGHIERAAPIEFLFGTDVSEVTRRRTRWRVRLGSGAELEGDMLVAGKGVAPNVEFIDSQQINLDRGVLVDDSLRTNVPNIWAAGDVAQGRNRLTGAVEVVANWIDAAEQGAIAGANMAGDERTFAGSLAENITTLFAVPLASIGVTKSQPEAGLREVVHLDERHGVYRKVVLRDDRLVGATLLRDVRDAGVLRGAIAAGKPSWAAAEAVARGHMRFADLLKSGRTHG